MPPDGAAHPDGFPADLKPFEAALGSLTPAPGRIDRDRLMYLAGAASRNRLPARILRLPGVFWPCAAAAMLVIAFGLGVIVATGQPRARIVYVDRPAAPSISENLPAVALQGADKLQPPSLPDADSAKFGDLALRERVLRLGVNALGVPSGSNDAPTPVEIRNRPLLNQLLGS